MDEHQWEEADSRRTYTAPRREEVDGRAPTPRGEAESRRIPRRVERRLEASPRRAARLYSRCSKMRGSGMRGGDQRRPLVRPQMRGHRGPRKRPRVVASARPATGARCARARRKVRWPHARPLRSHQRGQRGHQESRQKGCVMNTPRREAESRHTNTTPRREVADGRAPVGGGRQSTH